MKLFSNKKRIAAVIGAAAIVLGSAGIAAAFFTATGTGAGHANALTYSWNVANAVKEGAPALYPNYTALVSTQNYQTFHFKVTNGGSSTQTLTFSDITVKVTPTGSHSTCTTLTVEHTDVTSFGPPFTGQTKATLAPGASYTVIVTVRLPTTRVTQNQCQGVTATVLVNVASQKPDATT